MKNFSKTIAAISMSLLTVAAVAQSPSAQYANSSPQPNLIVRHVTKGVHIQGAQMNASHKVASASLNAEINYPAFDYSLCTNIFSQGYEGVMTGWGATHVNSQFTLADTGLTKGDKNYDLIQSLTVAYDSLYDVYSQSILQTKYTKIETIDTLWALVSYKNTTHTKGYIIFTGLNTVNGYPGNTKLFTDTVKVGASITQDTSLGTHFGDSLDLGYYIAVLPNYTLNGTTFAVNVTYVGSKADTLDVFYGYPYLPLCNNVDFPSQSHVGLSLSGLNYVNTFSTGWQKVYGSPTLMPKANGDHVFYGIQCGDTTSYLEQDAAIYASFTYSTTAGINNISASGLSVGQNAPNPFNKETAINYSLTNSSNVTFTVYDITGRTITTTNYGNVAPGKYQITLGANSFNPGIYFYTFNVNGSTVTKKMVVTQ